ncbi:MAG: helix-turn-helix transcriptional regulator [Hyphomicrobiales bacterium]
MSGKFCTSALKIARLRRKTTICELSKLSKLSMRELRRISRGEAQPAWKSVKALADALNFPAKFSTQENLRFHLTPCSGRMPA